MSVRVLEGRRRRLSDDKERFEGILFTELVPRWVAVCGRCGGKSEGECVRERERERERKRKKG